MFRSYSIFDPLEFEYIVESEYSSDESEFEILNFVEIETKNKILIKEKEVKYELYPLYINWKKIESKSLYNPYYNIFQVFGYFGVAIFNILLEVNPQNSFLCKCKSFLKELFNIYKKDYTKKEIKENEFFKKLINIIDDIISLIKNKIIIFKELSVLFIIMKLYETYYITIDDKVKLEEILKYQFVILSYINDNEYKQIYSIFYKRINSRLRRNLSKNKNKLPQTKKEFINDIKNIYKLTKNKNNVKK